MRTWILIAALAICYAIDPHLEPTDELIFMLQAGATVGVVMDVIEWLSTVGKNIR